MKQGTTGRFGYLAIALVLLIAACSTASYRPDPLNLDALRQDAETQTFAPLTVRAAVPGAGETEALFGAPLYDKGIQPVWLEITNRGEERVRLALVSIDPDYYSPLEVSYKMRKGFSREARKAMDKRFHEMGIGRFAQPGETISGFVFTHLSPGTKSFNVDLFGATTLQNFAFFIQVPGFLPDHAEVDFEQLYSQDEVRDLSIDEFGRELEKLPVYTTDADGQANGLPVNVVIVGNGLDVLRALLRAGWYESPAAAGSRNIRTGDAPHYLFGRRADTVFRIRRNNDIDRTELRVWLAPVRVDGEAVWLAQVTNFVGQRSYIGQLFFGAHLDPDLDDARRFMMQKIWYSQGLQSFAWSNTGRTVPVDQPVIGFNGNKFFTDGSRSVMWLSGVPYSLLDTTEVQWQEEGGP